jgi:hypothetical protein
MYNSSMSNPNQKSIPSRIPPSQLAILFLFVVCVGSVFILKQEMLPPSNPTCQRVNQEILTPATSIPPSTDGIQPFPTEIFGNGVETLNFSPGDLTPRAGFGISAAADPLTWANKLNSGWYINWSTDLRRTYQFPQYWQMIRLSKGCAFPSLETTRWMALHYPGQVWIIGNEPDVIWQDAITPEDYARFYHDFYTTIKSVDQSALVAVAGISQATPLRLQYLDRVLSTYQAEYGMEMPVDWWTVHGFVLHEERGTWGVEIPPGFSTDQGKLYEIEDHGSLPLFKEQIVTFRRWMAQNGYQSTPLALTEFGILMPPDYGFPVEFVQQYLQDTFQWLANARDPQTGLQSDDFRLVQRWAWFSLSDPLYPNADLADLQASRLTPLGQTFRQFLIDFKY